MHGYNAATCRVENSAQALSCQLKFVRAVRQFIGPACALSDRVKTQLSLHSLSFLIIISLVSELGLYYKTFYGSNCYRIVII
jgi:hypothetical protein